MPICVVYTMPLSQQVAIRLHRTPWLTPRPSAESTAIIASLLVYAILACFRLGWPDLASDEGRFGISAQNVLRDFHQLATVSEEPLGAPGTKPFLYPALLAVSVAALGSTEFAVRFVNVLLLAGAAWCLYAVALELFKNRFIAALAFCLFLLNPGTITYARGALPEPAVVFFGCLALSAACKFRKSNRRLWLLVCGVSIGLGFLCKLWLVLPFALACTAIVCSPVHRRSFTANGLNVGIIAVAAGVAASTHLLLVLYLTPVHWDYWRNMYMVFSFRGRIAGSGYDPAMWFRPWWFYGAALFKATFFALPMFLLGLWTLAKRRDRLQLLVITALLLPVIGLSFFRVKQASYIFPAFPGLVLVITAGCLTMSEPKTPRPLIVGCCLSALVAFFLYIAGVLRTAELVAIVALYLILGLAMLAPVKFFRRSLTIVAFASGTVMVLVGVIVVRNGMSHHTGYREIANYFARQLKSFEPGTVVFTAPEYPAMQFYTFRSGEYWRTYYYSQTDETFEKNLRNGCRVFYVVDPSKSLYGGQINERANILLQQHARRITSEIESRTGRIPVDVFVPLSARSSCSHN